ncbi:hypothetical protein GJ744_004166 [Endocarpon pusillum]|uniref:Galactosyl transferase GMA12/MNN10 family protein n=1 Tax=Endocarpon pusillum TaxID=364733 RepID=A0A8H7AM45_9EURO|nr:hypothetical protein GJ744_004166 [Endocarpon pusillum]
MRLKQFVFASTATLAFITFALVARQGQIRNALDRTGIGLLEKFRGTAPLWDTVLEENSIVVEHTAASDQIVPHRIGMVSMLIGDTNPTYERALRTHLRHGEIQGYETFVMRSNVLDMMYNKPMFILNILMDEMKKPFHERLEWLFWFDCDSVLMNPKLGLSHFLPPAQFSDANVLVTNDANGLNNGVFFIRVSAWAIEVMSANVAYRTFNPDEQLTFQDQSALDNIFHMEKFRDQVVYCPQRWFNAYQSGFLNESIQANQIRRGDLVVHFAGVGNKLERINYWCDIAEKHLPDWEVEIVHTSLLEEIDEFWSQKKSNDAIEKQELRNARLSGTELVDEIERNMTLYRESLTNEEQVRIQDTVQKVREQVKKQDKVLIWGAIQDLQEAGRRLEDLQKQTRKQTVKEAHATIIKAEKMGINAELLREMLLEANNWDSIRAVTKDLKAKVEMEAVKAQVKADIQQDISQALNQTANQIDETTSTLSTESPSQTTSETTSWTMPFAETVVVTARALKT